MLLQLLTAPVSAPLSGLTWISEKILEQAGPDVDEMESLQKQLLALQLSFDMGEVEEEAFEEQEEELLLAIDALEQAKAAEQANEEDG